MNEEEKLRKTEEFRTWVFFTIVLAPVLAVAIVSGWGFVVWIVILAIPVGLMLATFWSRSRQPGAARLETSRDDEPREPM